MINIGDTLKRAWQILWNYKLLWAFAFLLAISGGANSGSGGGGGGGGTGYSGNLSNPNSSPFFTDGNAPQWFNDLTKWGEQNILPLFATEQKAIQTAIWMVVGIFLVAILFGLLFALVRYPSETAILRMVDDHEAKGIKYKFKEAWKLGWNRRAFRIWLS